MDVYKIGVEIALTNSISSALSAISGQLIGMKGHVKDLEKAFSATGVAALGVGIGMLKISGAMLNNGAELTKQIGQMKLLLDNYKDVAKDVGVATRVATSTPGTTIAQNVKALKEIMPSVATEEEARLMLPRIMPDALALSRITGLSIDEIIQKGMKAEDLVGHNINPKTKQFDSDRMQKGFHSLVSMIIAGGGNIGMNDALNYAQQMAAFGKINDDENGFWKQAITPMLEMGGHRSGTSGQALGRQLIAGRMSKAAANNLIRQGVLDQSKVTYTGGGSVSVAEGGWKGEEFLKQGDFNDWFQKVWKPTLEAKNGGPLSNYDLIKKLTQGMSANTAARMASLFVMSQVQTARDQAMMGNVEKKDLYKNVMASDMGANINALSTSMRSLFSVLGEGLVPNAIAGLKALTAAISSFTQFMSEQPKWVKDSAGAGTVAGGTLLTGWGLYKGLSWLRGLGGGAATGSALSTGGGAATGGLFSKLLGGAGSAFGSIGSVWIGMNQDDDERLAMFARQRAYNQHHGFGESAYSGEKLWSLDGNRISRRRMDPGQVSNATPINLTPQIQATTNVNIDGKALAAYVTQMVIKSIGNLIPHPTGAPMAGTSQFAPAFDSGASH